MISVLMSKRLLPLLFYASTCYVTLSEPLLRSYKDVQSQDALHHDASLSAVFLEMHARDEPAGGPADATPEPGSGAIAAAAPAAASSMADGCSVCTYVLENKEVQQPFLCRGLQDPAQQIMVRHSTSS